ncbi:GspH/FimT family pseudopilin [Burkholderia sp. L27(2015)]|uniref:GspH/FimT family pseudopilin n=1 Tax=Burkholderia sp. L27(2015) TaxID=1641858 RepID=UPI00131E301E|nr:GspH/FimT family pseudopilin [Burkholderia sp. L27(2015)]
MLADRLRRSLLERSLQQGFVVPELMAVMALLVIVAMLAAPAFNEWLLRDRVDGFTRNLLNTFTFARNEALRLGARVDVCRDDGAAHCAKSTQPCGPSDAARADNWACGWLVVTEAQRDAGASSVRLLRLYSGSHALAATGVATALTFTPPAGQILGSFRTFEISPITSPSGVGRARLTRCIRLAIAGRPRLTEGPCGASR